MSPLSRRLFLTSIAASPLGLARNRVSRSYPNWTTDDADRVLTDSPWAKPTTVGVPELRAEIYLTVRWASALPVRQAFALQQSKAPETIEIAEPEYVVEIAGFPTTLIRQGARRFEAELADSARLIVAGRPNLKPVSAHVPEHGMHLMATLRFPKFETLDTKEGDIAIQAASGSLKVDQRFKLKDMIYDGRLEL